jgi:hypothetical protein
MDAVQRADALHGPLGALVFWASKAAKGRLRI